MPFTDPISSRQTPKILYKYREADNIYHLDIILKNELFLASPQNFNDPFDCKFPIPAPNDPERLKTLIRNYTDKDDSLINSLLNKLNESEKAGPAYKFLLNKITNSELFKKAQHEEVKKRGNKYGIYCLSEKERNILMWSHYAKSHSGFCVGFDSKILGELNTFILLSPIEYKEDFPEIDFHSEDIQQWARFLFLRKHNDWSYECEWRLVKEDGANKTMKFPAEMIQEIYFGMEIDFRAKERIVMMVRKYLPGSTKVFQMMKDGAGFKVNPEPVQL